jgi:hypothetical protein
LEKSLRTLNMCILWAALPEVVRYPAEALEDRFKDTYTKGMVVCTYNPSY